MEETNKQTSLKLLFAAVVLILIFANHESSKTTVNNIASNEGLGTEASGLTANQNLSSLSPINLSPKNTAATDVPKAQNDNTSAETGDNRNKPEDTVSATTYGDTPIFLVSYLDTDRNLSDFNADKRWPIASLTKLMTATIVAEEMSLSSTTVISTAAVMEDGTVGGFKEGEIFTVDDLLKALLVVSSNDAAHALAESYGADAFVQKMNEKAAELGMENTYFKEPTGLSSVNQSTANNLKILARYIYDKHRNFFVISRQRETSILDLISKKSRMLTNINNFAGREDFLGGKTGFITEAGENLLSLFARYGKPLIIIVMDSNNRFGETTGLLRSFDKQAAL